MDYPDFQFLAFEHRANGVLLITINRPEVMNATNARLHWELTKIWDVVNHDDRTKVAVITGAGDKAFSAGGDLDWISGMVGKPNAVNGVMKEAADIVYNMLLLQADHLGDQRRGRRRGLASPCCRTSASCPRPRGSPTATSSWGWRRGPRRDRLADAVRDGEGEVLPDDADFLGGPEAERMGLVSLCVPAGPSLMGSAPSRSPTSLPPAARPPSASPRSSLNNWMHRRAVRSSTNIRWRWRCFCFMG